MVKYRIRSDPGFFLDRPTTRSVVMETAQLVLSQFKTFQRSQLRTEHGPSLPGYQK